MDEETQRIHELLEANDVEKVSEMLAANPELVNATNRTGQSVFWMACCYDQVELVDQMLSEPIRSVLDPFKLDRSLRSALDAARKLNNREVIERLKPIFGSGYYGPNNPMNDPIYDDYGEPGL